MPELGRTNWLGFLVLQRTVQPTQSNGEPFHPEIGAFLFQKPCFCWKTTWQSSNPPQQSNTKSRCLQSASARAMSCALRSKQITLDCRGLWLQCILVASRGPISSAKLQNRFIGSTIYPPHRCKLAAASQDKFVMFVCINTPCTKESEKHAVFSFASPGAWCLLTREESSAQNRACSEN